MEERRLVRVREEGFYWIKEEDIKKGHYDRLDYKCDSFDEALALDVENVTDHHAQAAEYMDSDLPYRFSMEFVDESTLE